MTRPPLEDNADALHTSGAPPMRQIRLPGSLGPTRIRRLVHASGEHQEFEGVLPAGAENLCVSFVRAATNFTFDGRWMASHGGPMGSFSIPDGTRIRGEHLGEVDFLEFRVGRDDLAQLADEHGLGPGRAELRPEYVPTDELLARRMGHLRFALDRAPHLDSLYVDTMLEACLGQLVEKHVRLPSARRRRRASLSPTAMRRVCEFIDAHLDGTLRLDDLATVASISRAHFARAFRNGTGLSPHTYVMERRVAAALGLLERGSTPLVVIASLTGFSDHAHLTRTFQRQLRTTPSEARGLLRSRRSPHGATAHPTPFFASGGVTAHA